MRHYELVGGVQIYLQTEERQLVGKEKIRSRQELMDKTKAEGWKEGMGSGAQGQDWLWRQLRTSSKNRERLEMGRVTLSVTCWAALVLPVKGGVKSST